MLQTRKVDNKAKNLCKITKTLIVFRKKCVINVIQKIKKNKLLIILSKLIIIDYRNISVFIVSFMFRIK